MNRIFKVVWNKSLQRFVVASELAKGAKKERTHNARKKPKNNAMLTMLASTGLLLSQGAYSSDNNLNLHLLAPEHQVMSSIVYLAADNLGDTFPDRSDVVPFAANSKEAPVLINNDDISSQNRERIQYSINNYQGTGYFNLIIVDYDINQPLINPGKTALTISTTQTATNTNTGDVIKIGSNKATQPIVIEGDVNLDRTSPTRGIQLTVNAATIKGTLRIGSGSFATEGEGANGRRGYNSLSIFTGSTIDTIEYYIDDSMGDLTSNYFYSGSNIGLLEIMPSGLSSMEDASKAIPKLSLYQGSNSSQLKNIYGHRPYIVSLLGTDRGTYTVTPDTVWGGDPEALPYTIFETTSTTTTTVLTNANNFLGGKITMFDPTSTKLVFDSTFRGNLAAQITGNRGSVLIKSGADVKYLFDGAHTFTSGTTIETGAKLTLTNPGQVGKTKPDATEYAGKITINGTLVLTEGALASSKEFANNLSGAGILELQGSEPIGLKPTSSFEFSNWSSSFSGSLAISNINFDITDGGSNQAIANRKDFYINHHGWANLLGDVTLKNVYLNQGILNLTNLGDKPAKITGSFDVIDESYLAINELEEITNNDLLDLNDMHSKVLINFDRAPNLDQEELDNIGFMDGDGNEYSALNSDIKDEQGDLLGTAQYQYQAIQTGDKELSATYKITQLDINEDKVVKLGVQSDSYTLGALIMGAGGIELSAGDYAITLNNENTYTGGTSVTSGKVIAGKDQAFGLGSINIANGAVVDLNRKTQTITSLSGQGLFLLNSGHLTLNNSGNVNTIISGKGNLYITGDSTFNLENTNLNAVIEIKENSTLTEGIVGAFGDSSLEILGTAVLNEKSKTLNYALTGTGVVNVTADGFSLNSDKLQDYEGTLRVVDNASIALKTTDNLYKTQLELDGKGVLQLHAAEDYTFSALLKGTGVFDVNLGGKSFFTQSKNMNSFAGTLQLTNTKLSLSQTQSLQKTTVLAGADSIVTVGDSNQIGGLTLSGGEIEFTNDNSHLNVTNLDLSQGGNVTVTNDTIGTAGGEKTGSIIDQSNDQAFLDLITSSNQVTGDISDIAIWLNGNEVKIGDDNIDVVDYEQGGEKVAELSYGYGAMTSSNGRDGLFVTYGLEEVILLVDGTNALDLKTKGDQNFGTLLSGDGGIIFNLAEGNLTLDYSNIYTGSSTIRGGSANAIKTVTALQNNVLGIGGVLTIEDFSAFDLNGKNQSLSGLKGTGVLNLNAGVLTFTEGGDIATELTGDGEVIFTTGNSTIAHHNDDLNAQITIQEDATLNVNTDTATLGIGQIDLGGILAVTGSNDYEMNQYLRGNGRLNVNLGGKSLSFSEDVGLSYAGILNLVNTQFSLTADNQAPLTNAQLYLGDQSVFNIGEVGSFNTLKFEGGTANFTSSDGELTLETLDYTNGGKIDLAFDTSGLSEGSSLIEESEKAIDWDVMVADNIVGDLADVTLTINGHEHNPDDDSIFDKAYQQNGEHVADVIYGYEILETKEALKGLFVKSGIQSIDILDTKTLELALTNKNGTFDTLLTGSGSLLLNAGDYSLVMNETNNYTGNTTIGSGTVYANADNVLGSVGSLTLENDATLDLTNKKQTLESLQGTGILKLGGGILTLTQGGSIDAGLQGSGNIAFNAGETIVNSNNADLQASINIGENAALTTGSINALGIGELIVSGKLNIAHALNNAFSGSGEINTEVDFELASDQGQNFAGNYNVNKGQFSIESGTQMGSASFNIADIGTLRLSGDSNTTFNQALTGSGNFNVNLSGKDFNFGANAGQLYQGTLKLENTLFNLGNSQAGTSSLSNANAIKNATLWAGGQSVITIGQNNDLKSLVMEGGTLVYNNDSTILKVDNLTLTSGDLAVSGNFDITGTNNGASLIAQSNQANSKTIIISDNAVVGNIGNIGISVNGEVITGEDNSSESQYYQNNAGVSEHVADLVFDYTWSTTNTAGQYGIFANYQLSAVKILAEKILNLTATATDNRFNAELSGDGSVLLAGSENTALIIAKTNSYTGSTTINGGDVMLGANNALGATSSLNLTLGELDLKAFSQTVGELNSTGGTINLSGGSLTVKNGGHLENENALKGAGNITLQGGDLIVDAGNNDLSATITVDQPASITLANDASSLGSGDLLLLGVLNANGNVSIANNLQGQGNVNVNANTALTGNNNAFAGNFNVASGGNLNIDHVQKLGNASIINLLGHLNITGDSNESQPNSLSQMLAGSGTVKITNSILNISGNNAGFTGQYNFVDSTGVFSESDAFGQSSALSVNDNSVVTFDYNVGALMAALTGNGTLNFTQGSVSLGAANAANYAGSFVLKNNTAFNLSTNIALGSGSFDVSKDARLNILGAMDYQFNQALTGTGLLDINLVGKSFTFGDTVSNSIGNTFNGNILLQNTLFNLGETSNSAAVINSILTIGADSIVTIGQDNHLKGLILNAGTLSYTNNSNTLNVTDLSLTGGTLSITSSGAVNAESNSLIAQSNQKNTKEIILSENNVEGTLSDIEINLNGTIVDLSTESTTTQQYLDGAEHIADLTYAYDFNTSQNGKHGVFANYGLRAVNILQDKTLNLTSKVGEDTFSSVIEGAGNLLLNANNAEFTIAKSNSYTGSTIIDAGKVVLGANNALGNTSSLQVNQAGKLDLNDKTQTVGTLNNSGLIHLGVGSLIVSHGGQLNTGSTLTGTGSLQLKAGDLIVESNNTDLSAEITVDKSAAITLASSDSNIGTGDLLLAGTLNAKAIGDIANNIQGSGDINIQADTTLTGNNATFAGNFNVAQSGSLNVNSVQKLGSDSTLNLAGSLNIAGDNNENLPSDLSQTLTGSGKVNITNSALDISGNNTGFTGTYGFINSSGKFVSSNAFGKASALGVDENSIVTLDYNVGALTATLTGSGKLHFTTGSVSLAANNAKDYNGHFVLNNDVTFNLGADVALGNAHFNIGNAARLNVLGAANYLFNTGLTGAGLLDINLGGKSFTFGSNAGNQFTGKIHLENTVFDFNQAQNSTSVTNTTLEMGNDSIVSIGTNNSLKGLIVKGGTLNFGNESTTLNVTDLALDSGTLNVSSTGDISNEAGSSLIAQSNQSSTQEIVISENEVTGDLSNLTVMLNGNEMDPSDESSNTEKYLQAGDHVANLTYTYQWNTAYNGKHGIFANYGLSIVDILQSKTLNLSSKDGESSFGSIIEGAGNLWINASLADFTLAKTNSYTGSTTIDSGKVILGSDNALGKTSSLLVNNGATLDIAGKTQTVGAIDNIGTIDLAAGNLTAGDIDNKGTIDLNGGNLIAAETNNRGAINLADGNLTTEEISNSGTITLGAGSLIINNGGSLNASSSISGAGSLQLAGGALAVSSSNNLTGTVSISENAEVHLLTADSNLGTASMSLAGKLLVTADLTVNNQLSGNGSVVINAQTNFMQDNSGFTGSYNLDTNGLLTVSVLNQIGANSQITFNTGTLTFNGIGNGTANQSFSGTGKVNFINSKLSLTGDNSAYAGDYHLTNNSQLAIAGNNNLGSGKVNLDSSSELALSNNYGTTLANEVAGAGLLSLSNITLSVLDNKLSNLSGTVGIGEAATLNLNDQTALNSSATLNIDANGQISWTNSSANNLALNNKVLGSGLLSINANNKSLILGSVFGNDFAGTLQLTNSLFEFTSSNSNQLGKSTLVLNSGANVSLLADSTVNGLVLDGGRLNFTGNIAGGSQADSILTATNGITLNSGDIYMTGNAPTTGADSGKPILDQMGHDNSTLLVSGAVNGDTSNLDLYINNSKIDLDSTLKNGIEQGGVTVAEGEYSYGLISQSGANQGLYLNYGLQSLNLLTDGEDALQITTAAAGNNDLSVMVSGVGGLSLNAAVKELLISNAGNSYTGSTTITAGNVILGANNALGKTSQLNVDSTASLDIAGKTQTVGNIDNSGTIDVAAGNLTAGDIDNKGTIDLNNGNLTTGQTINSGTIDIGNGNLIAAETNNSGTINLGGGKLTTAKITNSGAITLGAGSLIINNGGSLNVGSSISGDGSLQLTGGTLAVSSSNNLTGTVSVSENAEVQLLTADSNLGSAAMSLSGKLLVNADLTVNNQLSGNGSVVINAKTSFTQDNSGFTGDYNLNTSSLLTVSALNQIGANSQITFNDGTLTFNGITGGIANSRANQSFSGNGTVNLTSSILSLTGDNSAYTGDYHLTNNSQLAITGHNNLGSGKVNLDATSKLVLSNNYGTTLANEVAGSGLLSLSNITLSILDSKLANLSGTVGIGNNATLNFNDKTVLNSNATLNIGTNGQINWANSSANNLTLNNKVLGSGLLSINANNQSLILGSLFGNDFAGTLQLTNSLFEFNNSNNHQLGKSTLVLNSGAKVSLLADSTVTDLVLDGGRLNFTGNIAGGSQADSILTAINGITLNSGDIYMTGNAPTTGADSGKPILDQMGHDNSTLLVSGAVNGDTSNLDLYINGSKIDLDSTLKNAIEQGGVTVAEGEYRYGLISQSGANQGLYLNYGLQSLNLLTDGDNALQITTTTAGNNDLSVMVSGVGGLSLNASVKELLISNAGNSYTGSTTITAGNVILGVNNALGKTSSLLVNNDATLDIAGKTQTVGNIDNSGTIDVAAGNLTAGDIDNKGVVDLNGGNLIAAQTNNSGTINLADGKLTTEEIGNSGAITLGAGSLIINNGGSLNVGSSISGAGSLQLTGGALAVSSSNNLTGTVSVSENAEVHLLTEDSNLGTAAMSLAGKLLVNADLAINNQLSGNGSVTINAKTNFTKDNSGFTGDYNLDTNGLLTVSALNQIGADSKIVLSASTLTFNGIAGGSANQSFSGNGTINLTSSILSLTGDNSAYASNYHLTNNSQLAIAGNNNLGSGKVNLDASSELALSNNYGTDLANEVAGAGLLSLSNITLSVLGNKLANLSGTVAVGEAATLNLNDKTALNTNAKLNIDAKGQINWANSSANNLTLNNQVLGSGVLSINANNKSLILGSVFGNDFAGKLQLTNSLFEFNNSNNHQLGTSTLVLSSGANVSLLADSTVNGLVLDGGRLNFTGNIAGGSQADSILTATNGITLNSGDIYMTGNEATTGADSGKPILDQIGSGNDTLLVKGTVEGNISNLDLYVNDTKIDSNAKIQNNIQQGGMTVATGEYSYGLVSGADKQGLYLNYGLQSLNLLTDGKLTTEEIINSGAITLGAGSLIINNGGSLNAGSSISGDGSLQLAGGTLAVSSSNALTGTVLVSENAEVHLLTDNSSLGTGAMSLAGKLLVNADLVINNQLSGNGSVIINAKTNFTQDNSGFAGDYNLNTNGSLTVSALNQIGANSQVTFNDGTLTFNGIAGDTANQSFSGTGKVNFVNSKISLTGDNSAYAGDYDLTGNSQLAIVGHNNLGSGKVNLDATSELALSNNYGSTLANEVAGAGLLSLSNISLSVFDNKLEAFTGAVELSHNATWKLNGNTILSGQNSTTNTLTLNNQVTGSGLLDVNAGNKTLLLGSNFGGDFAGTLQLANTSFTFDDTNKESLKSAGILLNSGSEIIVSADSKASSLVLNSGEMSFTANIPGADKADNILTVSGNTTLTTGKINVTGSETTGTTNTKLPLLDQMTNEHGTLLIDGKIDGDLSGIELTINGNNILKDDNVVADISQKDKKVAEGNYNYGLASQSEGKNGLYLHYGLQSINLIADGDDALLFATTQDGNNNLSVLLTGNGGIVLDASLKDLNISNAGNNYQGTTTINGGVINLLVDEALGNTANLVMNAGTLNLNKNTQIVGTVDIKGTINIADGGKLSITNGGRLDSENALLGTGSVDIAGGDLAVNASNEAFTGTVSIDQSASATLSNSDSNLGSGNLVLAGTLNVNGENNIQNSLSGQGTVNINANTILSGADNSQFAGLFMVGAGSALKVTSAELLGNSATIALDNKSASLNIASENTDKNAGNLTQTLKGNGRLNVNNSTLAISGDHTEFTGTYNVKNSHVSILSGKALGKNTTLDIHESGTVSLNYSVGQFDQTLTGKGILNFTTGQATLGNNAAQYFDGTILLSNSAVLNVSTEAKLGSIDADAYADDNLVTFDVKDVNSILNVTGANDFTFIAGLKGAGIVNIDLASSDNTLDLHPDTNTNINDKFTGRLNISNASLELDEDTSGFLKTAVMGIGNNANITIMDGEHKIGGVYLNGGNIYFKDLHDDQGSANLESDGTILVDSLEVSDKGGTIYVTLPKALAPDPIGTGLGILDYDDGSSILKLAEAEKVSGAIGILQLQFLDENGDEISNPESVVQNIGVGVTGTFDYKFTQGTGENLGLYVNYGLKSLSVKEGHTVLLGNPTTGNLDLSSSVSGEGGITISTDPNKIITLSNGKNSYTGETIVKTGGLRLEASGALGNTSALTLHENTSFDLNNKTQAIGGITAAQNTVVSLGSGALIIREGGIIAGSLTGSGRVTLDGASTLDILGANGDLTALFDIDNKATLNVNHIASAGSGLLTLSGDEASVNYLGVKGLIANSWTGSGKISIGSNESGEHSEVTLTKDNTGFNGNLLVAKENQLTVTDVKQIGKGSVNNSGTLIYHLNQKQVLNDHITGTGDFIKRGATLSIENLFDYAGNIRIESGNISLSATGILGSSDDSQGIYVADKAALNGIGQINGSTQNYGLIQVGDLEASLKRSSETDPKTDTLTFAKNLDNYGRINIAAAEGSAIVGNSLIIKGNYTGFEGASIYMNASLGDNITSKVDNLIIEGEAKGKTTLYVHDFRDAGAETNKQGIKIIDTKLSEEEAFVLGNTVMSGAYEYYLQHDSSDQNWYLSSYTDPAYRPDIGNNVSNVTVVTQSMVPGLNGLSGMRSLSRSWGDDLLKSSIWNTTGGSKSKGKTGNGQVSYHSDFLSTAFGGDHVFETETSAIQLGLMIGTMKAKSHSNSLITGSSGKSRVTGQTYGVYGSWFVDIHNPLSAYVDGSINYGNYNNKIMTTGNADISYRSHIWSYTVQGGYPLAISDNYVLEPQAQLTYLDYNSASYVDPSQTHTKQAVKGDVVARVGAFVYPKGGDIRPYAGINIWYDNTYATVSHDGITNRANKAGMMIEAKAGVNAQIDRNLSLSVDGHYRKGKRSIQDYGIGLTIQYFFNEAGQ